MTDDLDRLAGYGRETQTTREHEALDRAWRPIPPHPHPGSIGILLLSMRAALAERIKSELELAEQFAECKRRRERDRERIAELEAENERLRCCGNCGHYSRIAMTATYRCNEDRRMPGQHSRMPWSDCRFIPNKWTMREEATNAAD